MKRGQLTVVLNREAGTLLSLGPEQVEAGLREILAAMGCGVEILKVTGDKVQETLRQALHGSADAVIVGGGDGTVASAATIFAGQDKSLGILPLGTFNLAARDVGMSVDWKEAAAQLVTAPVVEADLLDVGGNLHFCVVVLGFYPALVMGQEEYHGNWLVKTVRTLIDATRSMATFPPLHLSLNQNEVTEIHRTRMALIANNDYEDMFGIIPARSSLDAGYFTVHVSKHRTRLGMARSVVAWLLGRWKEDREIISLRATEMEIDVKNKRRLPVMRDGEVDKMALPFKVTLRPKALRVISPRSEKETTLLPDPCD
ncbi:MAG: diacylglycerol/lipid kinase family protein [Luteolibacter sp.]